MSKFDFTSIIDRRGCDAMAIDGIGRVPGFSPEKPKDGFDIIPMWVADMNFPSPSAVTDAMKKRVEHPLFGYFEPREEYYSAIKNWLSARHGLCDVKNENIGYENGVLGGVVSALNVFCSRGDSVLVHSPVYIGFTSVLKNNGFHAVHSPLVKDENGKPCMNYDDMEEKIKKNNIHAAILCSPHNPTGRVWEKEELEKAYELFEKYDVFVVSDEIWSDLILEGRHIPSLSLGERARRRTVALYAPSKTFSLAGLVGSYHVIFDKTLRDRVEKESSLSHYNSMNVLSMHALIGAYSDEGAQWVDELRAILYENVRYAASFIRANFDGVSVFEPQGTYMLFIDCEEYCKKCGITLEELEKRGWDVGVAWQDGKMFFAPWSIRMNLALPKARVEEAMRRLKEYVFVR